MAGQKVNHRSFLHRDTMMCSIFDIKVSVTCFENFLSSQKGRKLLSVIFHVSQHNVVKDYCCLDLAYSFSYLQHFLKFLDDDLNYIPNWDLL